MKARRDLSLLLVLLKVSCLVSWKTTPAFFFSLFLLLLNDFSKRVVYWLGASVAGMWKTPAKQAALCFTHKFQSNKVNQTAGQSNVLNQMNLGTMGHSFNERNLDHLIDVLDIVLFGPSRTYSPTLTQGKLPALDWGTFKELLAKITTEVYKTQFKKEPTIRFMDISASGISETIFQTVEPLQNNPSVCDSFCLCQEKKMSTRN